MGNCGGTTNTGVSEKPVVLFVVGGPGSGKGTVCPKLVEKYGFTHLSTGDILRAYVAKGTEDGKALADRMKAGELVSTAELLKLMKLHFNAAPKGAKFLLDGYPRNFENLNMWGTDMATDVTDAGCLYLNCPYEEMEKRCLGRGQGRADDNEETIKKRLETFKNETLPVVEKMTANGTVYEVSSLEAPDVVCEKVCKIVGDVLAKHGQCPQQEVAKVEEKCPEKVEEKQAEVLEVKHEVEVEVKPEEVVEVKFEEKVEEVVPVEEKHEEAPVEEVKQEEAPKEEVEADVAME